MATRSPSPAHTPATIGVSTWRLPGVLVERYTYSAGTVEPLPKHVHAEYQIGLSIDSPGQYWYRGAWHTFAPGSVSVLHGDEAHAPSERPFVSAPATYWMVYADPVLLQTTAAEIMQRRSAQPFFPNLLVHDAALAQQMLRSGMAFDQGASRLEQDSLLLDLFAHLVLRHARDCAPASIKAAHPAIARVRTFLHHNYARNVSLQELADLAELSTFYLARAFRKAVGVPPHVYQIQVRIARAKTLLARGVSPANVAHAVGFYDQSHFGQHFKRLVGVTPGAYARESKNILYTGDERV